MRQLIDQATGLTFLIPEIGEYNLFGDPVYTSEDNKSLREFGKELNQYKDENITRYVLGGWGKSLGDFVIVASGFEGRTPCYVLEDGKLVATMIFTPSAQLDCYADMLNYINNPKNMPKLILPQKDSITNIVSLQKTRRILKKAHYNNTYINYVVVVPPAQCKGVATRMISAIKKNLEFFYNYNLVDANTISTVINFRNIPSRKVFSRNEFERACGQDGRIFHDYIYEL